MASAQQRVQTLTEEYQKLQTDLQSSVQPRQDLESQQQENKGVQKEFAGLDGDANIYKLMGPVLMKQDKTEAVMAVDGRLDFIEKQIKMVEEKIKETQDKSDGLRTQIIEAQNEAQEANPQKQVAA